MSVIENYTAANAAAALRGDAGDAGLFMYLAWHNTHAPLECPSEWEYPALPAYNNSFGKRMTFNCMCQILDDGVGNVTAALRAGGLWSSTLMLFSADNGGNAGGAGNNYPLKGAKISDFEGGVRAVAFLSGGYLPATVRGTHHTGYIAVADWYGTLSALVGVSPDDDVAGLPPVDSNNFWPSILTPNASATGRSDIFLSWSCTADSANVTGCDPQAPSIYNTSGDPTAGQGAGDMALISGQYKIIVGRQHELGVWWGPVYPNGSINENAAPCTAGCVYDIIADPAERVNLKATLPALWASMLAKLLAAGRTVYQTDFAEPGADSCFTKQQARAYYVGHNTCIPGSPGFNPSLPACNDSVLRQYEGPMCFHALPPVPAPPGPGPAPAPPSPAPPAPLFALELVSTSGGGSGCLVTNGSRMDPMTIGDCSGDAAHWTTDPTRGGGWLRWMAAPGAQGVYAKVDMRGVVNKGGNATAGCARGMAYVNPDEGRKPGPTTQGFAIQNSTTGAVRLASSLCPGRCLGFKASVAAGATAAVLDCELALAWTRLSLHS